MNWLWQGFYHGAAMLWETLWALVLGFTLSAFLQTFARREEMMKHFGKAGLREVGLATFLGAVSSSCSYAAVATARAGFKKGAALVPTLAFMFASTNLVLELGFILWLLMGWTFVAAEVVGAFVLIAVMWLLVTWTLPKGLVDEMREHAKRSEQKSCRHEHSHEMEHGHGGEMGHAHGQEAENAMFAEQIKHRGDWQHVAEAFFMDVTMLWKELLIGFLIAGFLMVLVPNDWWQKLFLINGPRPLRLVENSIVGVVIAMASFVCSVGNIPLASLLWSGGIGFGGVISFIYADLIVVPILVIYRKYYGWNAAAYITAILFASMVTAGIIVDLVFSAAGWVPKVRPTSPVREATFQWNYTTWLDFVALAVIGWFFFLHFRKEKATQKPALSKE